jgi:hypothetical protein
MHALRATYNEIHYSSNQFSWGVLVLGKIKVYGIYEMHQSTIAVVAIFTLVPESYARLQSFNH